MDCGVLIRKSSLSDNSNLWSNLDGANTAHRMLSATLNSGGERCLISANVASFF